MGVEEGETVLVGVGSTESGVVCVEVGETVGVDVG